MYNSFLILKAKQHVVLVTNEDLNLCRMVSKRRAISGLTEKFLYSSTKFSFSISAEKLKNVILNHIKDANKKHYFCGLQYLKQNMKKMSIYVVIS